MIEKDRETRVFFVSCDDCPATFEGTEDFIETVDKVKEEGWAIKKTKRGYSHFCPDCRLGEY
jgi:hypothetical protein